MKQKTQDVGNKKTQTEKAFEKITINRKVDMKIVMERNHLKKKESLRGRAFVLLFSLEEIIKKKLALCP